MPKGKTAVVTGSTSGIGLGIARAFAAQGANVMLNGFGQGDEIEFTRSQLQREHGVDVLYSGADMSRPEQIRLRWLTRNGLKYSKMRSSRR